MSKHTPGILRTCGNSKCSCNLLWAENGDTIGTWYGDDDRSIVGVTVQCPDVETGRANGHRLRDCWNACTGLADPDKYIARTASIRITIDTPNEICDGRVTDTVGNLIKRYGEQCLAWIVEEGPAAEIKAMREVVEASKAVKSEIGTRGKITWTHAKAVQLLKALDALAALKAEGEVKSG